MIKLSLCLLTLVLCLSISSRGIAHGVPKFPGSITSIQTAAATSDAIVVGQLFEFAKHGGAVSPGEVNYFRNRIKVMRILKGSFPDQDRVSMVVFSEGVEHAPGSEQKCIFFLAKRSEISGDPYAVIKVLPATAKNVALLSGP